ncbi:unnamed protein product [Durusdinium trenchii]|uniref:Uncharacterized protein n=1 Tax=Durusdinium trenchii TaxID=1381693 RepID=A0ABP0QBS5_9DINO
MFCDSEGKEARLVSGRWQADVTVTEDDNCGLAMFAFEMWKVNLSISRSFPARLFLSFSLPCAQRPEAVFEGQQVMAPSLKRLATLYLLPVPTFETFSWKGLGQCHEMGSGRSCNAGISEAGSDGTLAAGGLSSQTKRMPLMDMWVDLKTNP